MAKPSAPSKYTDPTAGPLITPRAVIALLLVVLGIAWIVYYYLAVRVDPDVLPAPEPV